MISFLHTADWQLGGTFQTVGPDQASQLRSARLDTVKRLLELGKNLDVNFVLSAGDNFESNQVSRDLLKKTAAVLNDYPELPIYLIPGNHDPLMEDYAFDAEVMNSLGDHVHILKEEEPVEVPGIPAVIYPGVCRQKKSSRNPLDWIPPRENPDRVRIGLAHGTLKSLPELSKDDYPIEEEIASEKDLDYLGLGHWHSTFPDPATSSVRTYYSGTPEPTGFSETDSGNVLLVDVDSPGSDPRIEKHRVAGYRWLDREISLSDLTSVDGLQSELLSGEYEEDKTLLRLKLEGTVSLEVHERLEGLERKLEDAFYFFEADEEDLVLIPEEDELEELVSGTGWLKSAIDYLEDLSSGEVEPPPESWNMDDPPTKEEAVRALELIYGRIRSQEG